MVVGLPADLPLEGIGLLRWHRLQLHPQRVVTLHLAVGNVHPITDLAPRKAVILTKLHFLHDPRLIGDFAGVRLSIELQVANPEMLDPILVFDLHFDMESLVAGMGIAKAGQELVKSGLGLRYRLLHFLLIILVGKSLWLA